MKVEVKLFASLRERLGTNALTRTMPDDSTVQDLLDDLQADSGDRPWPRNFHVAVNQRYVEPTTTLADGDVVALIPPVSGGAESDRFRITDQPLSLDEMAALVTAPAHGAIALFSGAVRGLTGDLETDFLEYEAYAEMAEQVFAQIAGEMHQKWPLVTDVAIAHRVGRLEIGESSVMIAVAAAHRQGVFDACAYAIERLKQIAPIWKKEVGPSGDFWVEGPRGSDTLNDGEG
ncbi:MAG: molybdopterin converting factor subunit 1 [Caldilineales bacterium]|nr:molybdopterin converting factor subunit 1 [Caldilineales bacterium]